jgi:hypothetical protein
MKKLIIAVLFSSYLGVFGQASESHNFVTYDTVYNSPVGYTKWGIRISRPAGMFTAGSPDTASRPAIITMPGQGEMGGDSTKLVVYGPHYFLANGLWDGSVQMSNGIHYPILITVTDYSNPWPSPEGGSDLLAFLLKTYHIKRNSVHLGGLSQGAFTWSSLIPFEQIAGAMTGMSMVTSLTLLEGFAIAQDAPYSGWTRGDSAFAVWARVFHGKYFGLEGTADYRNVGQGAMDMNKGTPGSAHFSYENIGGGIHGDWNSMYLPTANNWQSFVPYGPNVAAGADTNSRGTYRAGQSIFQWMLAQGDTSMVGTSVVTPPVNKPPVAIITNPIDTATQPIDSVRLICANSYDPDGTIVSYKLSQTAGPIGAAMVKNADSSFTVFHLANGSYTFQLTVTDNSGASTSTNATVIERFVPVVCPVCPPPVVCPVCPPQRTVTGFSLTLINGAIVTVVQFSDGTTGSVVP